MLIQKKLLIRLQLIFVNCLLLVSSSWAIDIGTGSTFHNHRFEAWGTSLAWWGNEVGGQSNANGREQLLDAFFDPDNGLGINFVRYNIGADQNPDIPQITRPGAAIEGYVPDEPSDINDPSTWDFDFSRDATQRLVLDGAINRGVTQVEAFSNSAPWWLTINQSSTGNPSGNNLNTNNYDEFIHYQLEVADHFEENLGVQFNTITPFNEPGSGFWRGGTNQEGLIISQGSRQSSFIRQYGQELIDRGSVIGLVGPEETSTDQTADSLAQYGNLTRSFLAQVNTHTYSFNGGSGQADSERLFNEASENGLNIYASEYGTGQGAVRLARQINSDIRYLDARAWTYWQVLEDNNGSGWGLAISNFNGNNPRFDIQDQYFAFRQFSTFIRPGSEIIELENQENVTAAYDPRTGTTNIVVTNAGADNTSETYNFNFLDRNVEQTRLIRTTDENNDLRTDAYLSLGPASVSRGDGRNLSFEAVGNAITSLVIHHKPNLIENGSFNPNGLPDNSPQIDRWQAAGNVVFDTGANNSSDGTGSAQLQTNQVGNSGKFYQAEIGDADTDLTGVAFQISADVQFRNQGNSQYSADTYLALEFYGADDETLTSISLEDYQTEIEPAFGVKRDGFESSVDGSDPNDSVYRTYLSGRFVAPAGTRYVRPVVRFDGVQTNSNSVVSVDNIRLQEVHPEAAVREWNIEGGGDLSNPRNWSEHALVENNFSWYFGNAINEDSTITIDTIESPRGITFFGEHSYHLEGSGSLFIGLPGREDVLIDVRTASHEISAETQLLGNVSVQVLAEAKLTISGGLTLGRNQLTKLGAGELDLSDGLFLGGGLLSAYASAESQILLGPDSILNGNFQLLAAPGEEFGEGDLFELVSYSALTDTFNEVLLPSLAEGLLWELEYGTSALTASVVATGLAGDFDADGDVDGADFLYWQRNGLSLSDLDLWQANFGNSQSSALQAAIVPEPTCLALMLPLALASITSRRQK